MVVRAEGLKGWWDEQTTLSRATLSVGTLGLAIVVLGSLVYVVVEGLVPFNEIVQTAQSQNQAAILYAGVALGAAAMLVGFGTYKLMPTKAARETAISGAVLGLQAVLFGGFYLIVRSAPKFAIFVRNFLSFEVLEPFVGDFLLGAWRTILLAFFGQALGMVLGLLLALLILSNRIVVRAPARVYINVFRGTPLIVQLLIGYFGIVLGLQLQVSPFWTAAVILGLNAGAYTAEIFRAGIQSLERGQLEAARSVGMTYLQAMAYVVVPQAVRRVIPPLMNEFVILIKDTSLVVILGSLANERELLAVGRDAYSDTFNATPYVASTFGYLVISLPLIWVVGRLERRLRSGLVGIGA